MGASSMKRILYLVAALIALCALDGRTGHASSNSDASACHHAIDRDRTSVSAMSDAAKKAEAAAHLKAAYTDEQQQKFIDCLSETKAAEALMQ